MNIEQMKSDLDQGIMLARTEIVKLVEAALLMECHLECEASFPGDASKRAAYVIRKVHAL